MGGDEIKQTVKQKYGQAALRRDRQLRLRSRQLEPVRCRGDGDAP